MAFENPTTSIQVDPGSHISETSTRVTFTALPRNEDAYDYWDEGVGHFSGNFEHLITVNATSQVGANGNAGFWVLSNDIDDLGGLNTGGKDALYHYVGVNGAGQFNFWLEELVAGTAYYDGYLTGSGSGVTLYATIERDESVGTYGTLYCYLYSNPERTTLVDTLTLTLHEKEDFRYLFMIISWNTGSPSGTITGWAENLDLQEAAAPVFMNQYRQRWA